MFNFLNIIRNNSTTFYDFDTQKRRSQKSRFVVTCLLSFIAAILCSKVSDNLLTGFLAVQSILLGFTVNVMFFLLGNHKGQSVIGQSIESQLRSERLRDLYHELFYNVSYFNLVAVASIIVATVLLLPTPLVPDFMRDLPAVKIYVHWIGTSELPRFASAALRVGMMWVFYTLAIEVVFSISRVIGRTSFYFEQKMVEMRDSNSNELS